MRNEIDNELSSEFSAIAESAGCSIAHVEFTGDVLRLVLDREDESVSVEDCATVSRQVSALLDVIDFDPGQYTLEVSSPGLDRPLYGPRDYERFVGRRARVTFREEGNGEPSKRTVVGRLEHYEEDGGGIVTFFVDETDERLQLPLERIERARLEIDI